MQQQMIETEVETSSTYSRPNAILKDGKTIEVRASAARSCRRALWYTLTGAPETDPPTNHQLTVMHSGNALEPVLVDAMERDGWKIYPNNRLHPIMSRLRLSRGIEVAGHHDLMAIPPDNSGGLRLVEVKCRNSDDYVRWERMGAELTHPESVAQTAIYHQATGSMAPEAIIAVMNTDDRDWDVERIPADRLQQAVADTAAWLQGLEYHLQQVGSNGPPPERDFTRANWQCHVCPFRTACRPPYSTNQEEPPTEDPPARKVTDKEAREALLEYEKAHRAESEASATKQRHRETLVAWLKHQGATSAPLAGAEGQRKISMQTRKNFKFDQKKLAQLVSPEVREKIITESESSYLTVK